MLSIAEINETENIFLAIDTGILTDVICLAMIVKVYEVNKEAHAYLCWLLGRWRILREDKEHLPQLCKIS